MTPSLHQAIEDVYAAFRDVPRPRTMEGCPCCIDAKGIDILLSKGLRDLTPENLTHYAGSALLTVGSVEDYVYFLPRILEILASERYWWPEPEVVTRAMHTAGFHSWPDGRRQALLRYFEEVISELLANEGSGAALDSWICALGRLHVDLAPFLSGIAENRPRLIEFYEVNSQELINGGLTNPFWDEAPVEQKQVVAWFRTADIQKLIEAHYGWT
ncbi:MAG TPA: hypothetical protein VEC99_13930 [Clostridia bacterium]|nr:hypothetical protein [Clostridia bacterium]